MHLVPDNPGQIEAAKYIKNWRIYESKLLIYIHYEWKLLIEALKKLLVIQHHDEHNTNEWVLEYC